MMFKRASKPITYEERKQIQKHISKGLSCSQTAKLIGRSKNGVVVEVRNGGGRFYNAKTAQIRIDEVNKGRYERLSVANTNKANGPGYKERIENLEMQIEILHDCVKELMGKCING